MATHFKIKRILWCRFLWSNLLGILYIKKDDGTLLEDEEAVFKYIPDKTDGILTREVKPTLVKPANVMGLEEIYEEDDEEETDEVVSS